MSEHPINLLPPQRRGIQDQRHLFKKIEVVAIVVVCVVSAIAIALWAAVLVIQRQLAQENDQITALQADIASQSKKEQQFQLLSNRLQTAAEVIKERSPLQQRLDSIVSLMPAGVSVEAASLTNAESTGTLQVAAKTYESFEELMTVLQESRFSGIRLTTIHREVDGIYRVAFEVIL